MARSQEKASSSPARKRTTGRASPSPAPRARAGSKSPAPRAQTPKRTPKAAPLSPSPAPGSNKKAEFMAPVSPPVSTATPHRAPLATIAAAPKARAADMTEQLLLTVALATALGWAAYEQAFLDDGFLNPAVHQLMPVVPTAILGWLTYRSAEESGKLAPWNHACLVLLYCLGTIAYLVATAGLPRDASRLACQAIAFVIAYKADRIHSAPTSSIIIFLFAFLTLDFVVYSNVNGVVNWRAGITKLEHLYMPVYSVHDLTKFMIPAGNVFTMAAAAAGASRAISAWNAKSVHRMHLVSVAVALLIIAPAAWHHVVPLITHVFKPTVIQMLALWSSLYFFAASI